MAAPRTATIVAAVLEVHCPHCGDAQPNPVDESHLWTPAQIAAMSAMGAKRVCNACDEPFQVIAQARVGVLES